MSFDFVFSSIWQFSTNHAMADPGVRHYRWNDDANPTQLAVSVIDDDGVNRMDDFMLIYPGNQIALRSTSTAKDWGLYEVLNLNVIDMAWALVDVVLVQVGDLVTEPSGNNKVLFDIMRLAEAPLVDGPISARRDEMIARVATLLHVSPEDVWVAAAVDSAIEYAVSATCRDELGLPDTPLTVNGVILFAQKLYTDSPNGAMVAIGDPSFEPIFQPESLWKHVRHYFDHLDVAWGVS